MQRPISLEIQAVTAEEQNEVTTNEERLNIADFEAMAIRFNGHDYYDVRKWFDYLEDMFAMYRCANKNKFMATRRLLRGTAEVVKPGVKRSIRAKMYEELKQKLILEFGQTCLSHAR